jgi:oleandomycin transport system ATP-binding protein
MTNVIEAESLTKSFGATRVLAGVSIVAKRGQVLALLGSNGPSKRTVVRILPRFLRPDARHASICGYDMATQAVQVRKLIALVGQYASVDEELTGTVRLC